MLRKRIIPTLLLKNNGLVKTQKFKDSKYVGDAINAVWFFNEKEVDEIIFLDISATINNKSPNFELIKDISTEAFMPFSYGGGIKSINQIEKLIALGVEKVVLNSILQINPEIIEEAAKIFGSQSIVASIDVKESFFGYKNIYYKSGKVKSKYKLFDFIKMVEDRGVGEIIINSIDKDGMMTGYDIKLIKEVNSRVKVPLVAIGGGKDINDIRKVFDNVDISGISAGSMFVFNGPHRAVLISYPKYEEIFKNE